MRPPRRLRSPPDRMTPHPVAKIGEIPPGGRKLVTVGKITLGIFNVGGEFFAYRNICPHAGAPVCEGRMGSAIVCDGNFERRLAHEGKILRCPWHAWEFLLPEGVTLTKPVSYYEKTTTTTTTTKP